MLIVASRLWHRHSRLCYLPSRDVSQSVGADFLYQALGRGDCCIVGDFRCRSSLQTHNSAYPHFSSDRTVSASYDSVRPVMSSKATNKEGAGVPKHRACDECRSRKLACSKEPDGCSRCKKEGITCHYSPQKPMGRPRKRRHVEDEEPSLPKEHEFVNDGFISYPNHVSASALGVSADSTLPLDPSLSFLENPGTPNLEFLDLLPDNYLTTIVPPEPQVFVPPETHHGASSVPFVLTGVDLLEGINFDEPDPSQAAASKDFSDSLQQYMTEQLSRPLELVESPPTDATTTPESDQSVSVDSPASTSTAPSVRAVPTVNCGCLSALYLALDSLARLPNEALPAMRVARNASKTAHDVINCPTCSLPLIEDPTAPPPIQCFQNMMFLGALVPSACNAYAAILEMVDAETALAKKQGRNFWFTFKEVGGLWGNMGVENASCGVIENYDNKSMPPDMWRLTVRALLRLDVYGMNEVKVGSPRPNRFIQQGLKDVVDVLEERSRLRHNKLDEMAASGQVPEGTFSGVIYPKMPVPPEQRNCVKILETARIALENLVIA